jgi:hypothetical protein
MKWRFVMRFFTISAVFLGAIAVVAGADFAQAMCAEGYEYVGSTSPGVEICCRRGVGRCGDRCCDEKKTTNKPRQRPISTGYSSTKRRELKNQADKDLRALSDLATQAGPSAVKLEASEKALEKRNMSIQDLIKEIKSLKDADRVGGKVMENLLGKEKVRLASKLNEIKEKIKVHDDGPKPTPNTPEAIKFNKKAQKLDEEKRKIQDELVELGRAIGDASHARSWARKKLDTSNETMKKYVEAQKKLRSKISKQESELAPYFRGMRDRCQSLAKNPAIVDSDLAAKCGSFFDGNNPKLPVLKRFGVKPIKPRTGKVTEPFKWSKPPVKIVPPSGYRGGLEPGSGVPPVGPSGPVRKR